MFNAEFRRNRPRFNDVIAQYATGPVLPLSPSKLVKSRGDKSSINLLPLGVQREISAASGQRDEVEEKLKTQLANA